MKKNYLKPNSNTMLIYEESLLADSEEFPINSGITIGNDDNENEGGWSRITNKEWDFNVE